MNEKLLEYLELIPKDWHWQLIQPPKGYKGKVSFLNEKGKEKWREVRYTVYVSNGETFSTPFFTSATIDSDNLEIGLLVAIRLVQKQEQELRDEAKQEKEKRKKSK